MGHNTKNPLLLKFKLNLLHLNGRFLTSKIPSGICLATES